MAMDLDRALAQLEGNQKLCVVLSYAEGMSHGEISDLTGLPLGTVKSHVRRGAQKLQSLLTRLDHDHRAARRRNLALVLVALIIALPLAPWMADAADTLTTALITPGSSGLWQALAPLNSVAGILLMTGLLLARLLHLAR